ncbi:hypothetical protein J4436_01480 [Candidatus Woesearchaeota archaeon]|nr:hypothetical protein [Candidatus Woesearchaeota archaeon]
MEDIIKIIKENPTGTRPNWDEYFMTQAILISSRSSCINVRAGSVITIGNRLIGSGYNGAPKGIDSCINKGLCVKETKLNKMYSDSLNTGNCIGVHSEMSALANINSLLYKDATIYTTIFPCTSCTKTLITYNIKKIIFKKKYNSQEVNSSLELIKEANLEIFQLDLSSERTKEIIFGNEKKYYNLWDNN